MKLVESSKFYALRFTQSHYETEAKVVLKKLERLVCKIEKRKADIKFEILSNLLALSKVYQIQVA